MDNSIGPTDLNRCRIWSIKMINMYLLIFTRASVDSLMVCVPQVHCISLVRLLGGLWERITGPETGTMCKYSNRVPTDFLQTHVPHVSNSIFWPSSLEGNVSPHITDLTVPVGVWGTSTGAGICACWGQGRPSSCCSLLLFHQGCRLPARTLLAALHTSARCQHRST